jgi:hypothetical protein
MIAAAKTIDKGFTGCNRDKKAEACFDAFQRFATRLALPFVSGCSLALERPAAAASAR